MKKYLPALAVILAAFLWSLDGFLRQRLFSLSSFTLITLEHILGAVIFFPLLVKGWKEIQTMNQRHWVSVLWISICGGILGTFFYTKALSYVNYIDLSVVVLLQKFQPLFAIALAAVILKEPITKRFFSLALSAILGGYLITFGTQSISDWDDHTLIAALLAILAAFSWGSSTVLGKHALRRLSFPTITALRLVITAALTTFILLSTGRAETVMLITHIQWGYLLLIVFSTGSVALFFYYYGLKHLPASHTTIYELFWPLSAVALDWFVRGRTLQPVQWFGMILLLGSIILLTQENSGTRGKIKSQ